jgi:DNA replication protein DnaC
VERKEKTLFVVDEQQSSKIAHNNYNNDSTANLHNDNGHNYSNGTGKKLLQVFKYLLELKRLTAPVIREIESYGEKFWWVKDLPVSPKGCHLRDSSEIQNKDAWLEVHKQRIPPYPEPNEVLGGWIAEKGRDAARQPSYYKTLNILSPDEAAELSSLPNMIDEMEKLLPGASDEEAERIKKELEQKYALWEKLEKNREVKFNTSLERVKEWDQWLLKWKSWAEDALPRMQIQKLYSDLFAVYQRFQKESEDLEIVWGHALLCWKSPTYSIRRPLLGTKVELLFDSERGIFSLLPIEGLTRIETDMLSKIDLPNLSLLSEIENSISSEIDPWQNDQIEGVLKRYLHALDERGEVRLQEHDSKNVKLLTHPVVVDQPVIFLRKGLGRIWEKDLKEIISALEQGHPIPKTLESLVTEGQPEPDAETLEEWQHIAEDILFPKASSEEQKEILRRLTRNFGVLVQGPPGTGKSHTIVNLICHLLAHGKRVLVTSQAERALRVIGSMIPENVKPLCVSVLGGDSRSADELEHAITKISENLASIDEFSMEKEVQTIQRFLRECRKTLSELRLKLKEMAQKEHQVFKIEEKQLTTLEVSKWLSENKDDHGWLPDNISADTLPPLSDEMIARLFSLQGLLLLSDAIVLKQQRVSLDI